MSRNVMACATIDAIRTAATRGHLPVRPGAIVGTAAAAAGARRIPRPKGAGEAAS
jgi:hypothetical protein